MPDLRVKLQSVLGAKYRIVRELTGGGMSRVFLAHDESLEREVVVKVLSPDIIDSARVERFRQEVLQTARLQHPTIVPVIEVGAIKESGGDTVPYYVMPYAKGESLRSRMRHDGQLSLGVAMRVLRGVFDALAYAHTHGVVHRDVKPENIFLSGGHALLADFGIAKAIAGPGSRSGVTQPGMAVGTPTYMAPEQLVDADRVGPAADIYAAGLIGYEMLTGRLPWDMRTPVDLLAAQAQNRIIPLRTLRADVPENVAALIEACLAWEPAERPASATEALQTFESLAVRLTPDTTEFTATGFASLPPTRPAATSARRRVRTAVLAATAVIIGAAGIALWRGQESATTPMAPRRIAILYPVLPTGIERGDEIAAQLYQMLSNSLAPVSGLRLAGRVTVPRMTEQGMPATEIADSLQVEGVDSVLVIVTNGASARPLQLSLQMRGVREIAGATVAGPITVDNLGQILPDSLSFMMRRLAAEAVTKLQLASANHALSYTQLGDAYIAWLSGRDAMSKRTPAGLREAIEQFEQAIALDSSYAQAHADLAQTMALALVYHYQMKYAPFELATRALRLADRAVELRPEFADGYLARGLVGTTAGAPIEFIRENYETVADLLSANPYSQTWYLGVLGKQGQFVEAVQRAEEEVHLDPHSAAQRVASALYALPAGLYATAIRNAAAVRASEDGSVVPLVSQLELWGRLRLGGTALADCRSVPSGPYLGAWALCLERTGGETEGRATFTSLETMLTQASSDSTFDLALPLGEMALYESQHEHREASRTWLREAFSESPAGIDYRLMRAGFFTEDDVRLADSLQLAGWNRIRSAAREASR